MEEQITDLNQLLKKYKAEIDTLEEQIKEKKEKMQVIYNAMKLLQQEGMSQLIPASPSIASTAFTTESLSEKYRGMKLNDAILDVLSNSEGLLDGFGIYEELIKNGFTSGSSNIKRDVYISLYRLNKDRKLISKKSGNKKKYIIRNSN